jgi:hypothetical protein
MVWVPDEDEESNESDGRVRQICDMDATENAGSGGLMGLEGKDGDEEFHDLAVGHARIERATSGLRIRCST